MGDLFTICMSIIVSLAVLVVCLSVIYVCICHCCKVVHSDTILPITDPYRHEQNPYASPIYYSAPSPQPQLLPIPLSLPQPQSMYLPESYYFQPSSPTTILPSAPPENQVSCELCYGYGMTNNGISMVACYRCGGTGRAI